MIIIRLITLNFTYTWMRAELAVIDQERDLEVIVKYAAGAVKKANSMLVIIRKAIKNKSTSMHLLYKVMV